MLMAKPLSGSRVRILRRRRSRVPWTRSEGLDITEFSLGNRAEWSAAPLGKQGGGKPQLTQGQPELLLLVAQGDDGIDAHRAPSGDGASRQGHDQQDKSDAQESEPVARSDTVKQAPQETRECEAGDDAKADAREGGADSLTKHHPHNVPPLCPECDA